MAHVQDTWYTEGDKDRPTARCGKGKRWKARYLDPEATERSRTFGRKTDAETFLAHVQADLLRGTYLDPDAGRVTLRRYTTGWLASRLWDAGTRQVIEARVHGHILPALGGYQLDELARRPSVVSGWVAGLDLSARYAGHILGTLSAILQAAVDDGVIRRNPCRVESVKAPKVDKRKLVPWETARVTAVRAEMPERYQAMVDAGADLGLRQGEITGLPLDAVGFLRRNVRVRIQVRLIRRTLVFAPPKGGRERDVPLPESANAAIAAHLAQFPAVPVTLPWKEPGGKPRTETLIFTTPRGVIHRNAFNKTVWRPARQRAGVPDGKENGMHALRHHYASVMLAGGVDIGALSEYLGHYDPGFTLRVYRHLMPKDAETARRAVEAALASSGADGSETATGTFGKRSSQVKRGTV